jgi:hypothetical protein
MKNASLLRVFINNGDQRSNSIHKVKTYKRPQELQIRSPIGERRHRGVDVVPQWAH